MTLQQVLCLDSEMCIMWISVVMADIHIGYPLLNNKIIQGCSELYHAKARMSSTSCETSKQGVLYNNRPAWIVPSVAERFPS